MKTRASLLNPAVSTAIAIVFGLLLSMWPAVARSADNGVPGTESAQNQTSDQVLELPQVYDAAVQPPDTTGPAAPTGDASQNAAQSTPADSDSQNSNGQDGAVAANPPGGMTQQQGAGAEDNSQNLAGNGQNQSPQDTGAPPEQLGSVSEYQQQADAGPAAVLVPVPIAPIYPGPPLYPPYPPPLYRAPVYAGPGIANPFPVVPGFHGYGGSSVFARPGLSSVMPRGPMTSVMPAPMLRGGFAGGMFRR